MARIRCSTGMGGSGLPAAWAWGVLGVAVLGCGGPGDCPAGSVRQGQRCIVADGGSGAAPATPDAGVDVRAPQAPGARDAATDAPEPIAADASTAHDGGEDASVPETTFVTLTEGDMSAVVVPAAGNPLVFFRGNTDLKLVECRDPGCSAFEVRSLEVPGDTGIHPHARLDAEGRPIVSYHQATFGGEAKLLRCADPSCSDRNQFFFENGGFGLHNAIALSASGFPIVSYFDEGEAALRAAICSDAACEGFVTREVAGGASVRGEHSAVAVGADTFPVFAYYDATEGALGFTHCANAGCSELEQRRLDGAEVGDVGTHTAMTIADDGMPLIFYHDAGNGNLKVAKCDAPDCPAPQIRTLDGDSATTVGLFTSVAMPADGRALVSYYDATHGDLKVARCADAACTAVTTHVVDGVDSDVGQWTSIALRPGSDLPVLSYHDVGAAEIKLAFCGTRDCSR